MISWFMILILLTTVMGVPSFATEQEDNIAAYSDTGENPSGDEDGGSGGGSGEGTAGESGGNEEDSGNDTASKPNTGTQNTTASGKRTYSTCQYSFPEWSQRSWGHIRNCEKCGSFRSEKHTYSTAYVADSDGKGHWLVCDECEYKKNYSQHVFSDDWTSDATGHWKECSLCQAAEEVESHIPGAGANETREQICTECEYI